MASKKLLVLAGLLIVAVAVNAQFFGDDDDDSSSEEMGGDMGEWMKDMQQRMERQMKQDEEEKEKKEQMEMFGKMMEMMQKKKDEEPEEMQEMFKQFVMKAWKKKSFEECMGGKKEDEDDSSSEEEDDDFDLGKMMMDRSEGGLLRMMMMGGMEKEMKQRKEAKAKEEKMKKLFVVFVKFMANMKKMKKMESMKQEKEEKAKKQLMLFLQLVAFAKKAEGKQEMMEKMMRMGEMKEEFMKFKMWMEANKKGKDDKEEDLSGPFIEKSTCSCYPCLIFEDNFNTFDLHVWEHEITAGGGGNWEFQYYNNNRTNSYVRDGILYLKPTLTSEKFGEDFLTNGELNLWGSTPADACTGNQFYGCQRHGAPGQVVNPIQSARIRSSKSVNFKYGRLEVEAKMPTGDWLWPAIWLLPRYQAYGTWPASGEIDLVESRGNMNLTDENGNFSGVQAVGSTLHFGPFVEVNQWPKAHATKIAKSGTFGDSFHKYRMDWGENGITFLVDDEEILKVDPGENGFWGLGEFEKTGNGHFDNTWAGRSKMAPFDQEFYIIMNVAVGGVGYFREYHTNYPYPKPWNDTSGHGATDFWNARKDWLPTWRLDHNNGEDAAMQVNYVKIWKLKADE